MMPPTIGPTLDFLLELAGVSELEVAVGPGGAASVAVKAVEEPSATI